MTTENANYDACEAQTGPIPATPRRQDPEVELARAQADWLATSAVLVENLDTATYIARDVLRSSDRDRLLDVLEDQLFTALATLRSQRRLAGQLGPLIDAAGRAQRSGR